MNVYNSILQNKCKQLAILIDPEQCDKKALARSITIAGDAAVDFIMVGGSLLLNDHLDDCIKLIKRETALPVILFPGSELQVNGNADAILLLSLISGRNPEMLIGKHVVAAPYLKESGLEIIPTGYMLIESGNSTTALYMSNTHPIPREKDDVAVCTAMAGDMLGLKMIYMDAGSGAAKAIPESMIRKVKQHIGIPLIVGGGIRDPESAGRSLKAGADILVVGTAVENDPGLIRDISAAVKSI